LLQPVVHSFLQVIEDVERLVPSLDADRVWARPNGAASVGFHCRHIAGATDRLLTYARGEALRDDQLAFLKREGEAGDPPESASSLAAQVRQALEQAIAQVTMTPIDQLTAARAVGRARLPATVLGLLFHAAEHATRHAGQIATLAKVVGAATPPQGS
jgi:uncharacterized damage-inducible protein DinB